MIETLRLLTLQIVEGRMTVESARAVVLIKAQAERERNREYQRHHRQQENKQVERAKAAVA